MYVAPVEIFSDETNMAVLRHPGRKFPGLLIQGDSCAAIVSELRRAMKADDPTVIKSHVDLALDLLEEKLAHYTTVLKEHGIEKPWGELEA